jgi:3-hydroxyisobutyrate dehydrogenase
VSETIAFIGLGNMGGPMAANLMKAGVSVKGFDLSETSCETAAANGVTVAATAADAAAGADTVSPCCRPASMCCPSGRS